MVSKHFDIQNVTLGPFFAKHYNRQNMRKNKISNYHLHTLHTCVIIKRYLLTKSEILFILKWITIKYATPQ
jgi:hypothetical protein